MERMNTVGCAFSQFYGWSPLRVLGLMLALAGLLAFIVLLFVWLQEDLCETKEC